MDDLDVTGHFMYVLTCADGSFYAGYTAHMGKRLAAHQRGVASRYTRARRPVALEGWWAFSDKREAMQAEYAFKQLTRREKVAALAASGAPITAKPGWLV
jgi:putative endonuclease